jgi:hypothetical protein
VRWRTQWQNIHGVPKPSNIPDINPSRTIADLDLVVWPDFDLSLADRQEGGFPH